MMLRVGRLSRICTYFFYATFILISILVLLIFRDNRIEYRQRQQTYEEESRIPARVQSTATTTTTTTTISSAPSITRGRVHKTKLMTRDAQCAQKLDMVVMVTTHAWNGRGRRKLIRDTWGRKDIDIMDKNVNETWQTFFVVGSQTEDPVQRSYIENEHSIHKDVIQGDFKEDFYNLPYKLQVCFEWVHLYCAGATYLFKADDDIYLNRFNTLKFLKRLPYTGVYHGAIHHKRDVHREKSGAYGKYAVTKEEYPHDFYPPFIAGAGMILSRDVVSALTEAFSVNKVFKLDDVYIGILVDKLGFTATGGPNFIVGYLDKPAAGICRRFPNALVRHVDMKGQDWRWCLYKLYLES